MARTTQTGRKHFNILALSDEEVLREPPPTAHYRDKVIFAAAKALRKVRLVGSVPGSSSTRPVPNDLVHCLGVHFGFQEDNVRNQREHVILLLANHKLRSVKDPNEAGNVGEDDFVMSIKFLHDKLLQNYIKWCSFIGVPHEVDATMTQLAYPCLYLLIWGEASNLRFMPECLCYIFHHMAKELKSDFFLESTMPPDAFNAPASSASSSLIVKVSNPPRTRTHVLDTIIKPIYDALAAEAKGSKNGRAPHSSWRNYDDMNEFFWSPHCLTELHWPFILTSDYLTNIPKSVEDEYKKQSDDSVGGSPSHSRSDTESPTHRHHRVTFLDTQQSSSPTRRRISLKSKGRLEHLPTRVREREQKKRKMEHRKKMGFKVGFVEQRSFWNIFHSFHRLWITQFLVLQILITLAFSGDELPWILVLDRDTQFKLLYVFITWAALQTVQAMLTLIMHFTLISRNTKLLFFRMVLKVLSGIGWVTVFSIMLARIDYQRTHDGHWSDAANVMVFQFLEAAAVFLIPEILATFLFFMPFIANYIKQSDKMMCRIFTWWFYSRNFVGRGLHQSLADTLTYTFFWLIIFAAKISFSYQLQIRLLVSPTRELLQLKNLTFEWHEFFQNHNRFVVAVLWAPVILIYLMDIQIWYAVWSSIWGVMVGLLSHIGEVRNMQQLQLRFPFFASATTFNLLASSKNERNDQRLRPIWDTIRRLKIRYGLDKNYVKLAEDHWVETEMFALLWNFVIKFFRDEDLVSNEEVDLLTIPPPMYDYQQDVRSKMYNRPIIQWPVALISNEIANALHVVQKMKDGKTNTAKLWGKISSNDYRKHAVLEAFYSLWDLVCKISKNQEMGKEFENIEQACRKKEFLVHYNIKEINRLHALVLELLRSILDTNDKLRQQNAYISLLYALIKDFRKDTRGKQEMKFDENWLISLDVKDYAQLRRLQHMLTRKENITKVPRNLEARRRLAFFSNSLFMTMPKAPLVDQMLAFSVLIPYYTEDVIYSHDQLKKPNEDGINILFYLEKIFPDEWENYQERTAAMQDDTKLKRPHGKDDTNQHLRLWASYRGQTLGRTVRGMMYYHLALRVLAWLDNERQRHPKDGTFVVASRPFKFDENSEGWRQSERAASIKFTLVVACQIYGNLKNSNVEELRNKAADILYLLRENPAMRVAYVDENPEENRYEAVLVKYDQEAKEEVEIYRIKLPGAFKIGEGKPENQNQAIIFTRGEALQTIDMNQDSYFEEALKVRNLLQEFVIKHEKDKPRILGIREHVFTGSVSSLASFMSAQETSFVTIGQRVLANPLKVRMHYGHPDMFDRLWFLSRGGISKASRAINISEDIFAGYNCALRGGSVTHHEYIQVGKGRDVGLNQITTFEAKVSGGNGEQTLSRDLYRLGHHLDFFRMFSLFYTTIGFYFGNLLVILAAYAFMWGRVYLALSGIIQNFDTKRAFSNSALSTALNQQFIVQIGVFSSVPLIIENSLEHGFTDAVWQFILMQLQLCSVFYTFSLGTKGHYYGRTLLHGGAEYKSTGRGFVIKRESFTENYRFHSRSHFVKAIELIILLIIYDRYGKSRTSLVYSLMELSFWFLALSWLLGPFVFNPSGFDWLRTVYDYEEFQTWLWQDKGSLRKPNESWEVWWSNEQEHLNSTGHWGRVLEVILSLRFFLIQYGMVYRLNIAAHNKSILVYMVSWTYVVVAVVVYMVVARAYDRYAADKHIYYRSIQVFVVLFIAMVIVLLVELTDFQFADLFLSMIAFLPTGWGLLCIGTVFRPCIERTPVWNVIVEVARLYDLAMGMIVLAPVAVFSWLPGFQSMQTRILFNQAFSRGLQISKLLTAKKATYRGNY